MINYDGEEVGKEFEEAFGKPITSLTVSQLWWLTKFAKHVRGRCRNNSAFNNYMNRNFKSGVFVEVSKTDECTGKSFKGLHIEKKAV